MADKKFKGIARSFVVLYVWVLVTANNAIANVITQFRNTGI